MNIELVRAMSTPEDVNEYIRIARQVRSRFNCVAVTVSDVVKEIERSIVHLIRVDGQTVGFISYVYRAVRRLYISEVQIEPSFQGKGIGGFALDYVLEAFPKVELFELHTHPESRAQHMYARHGFRATGEVSENHRNTGEPRIVMVLERKAV